MTPWIEKFGRPLSLGKILRLGGVRFDDLPKGSFTPNGGSPCWNYLLDVCSFKNCDRSHIEGLFLPQGYPGKLCQVLRPAMRTCYNKFSKAEWKAKENKPFKRRHT